MCHWIRIVRQLMFKCCYFDFVYCDFDVDHLVFEIQISFYRHLFLSANVRHIILLCPPSSIEVSRDYFGGTILVPVLSIGRNPIQEQNPISEQKLVRVLASAALIHHEVKSQEDQ